MVAGRAPSLALIIQNAPYRNRVARADIDFALAAATLDFDIRVYLPGLASMQLVTRRNAAEASLPAGYRAWAALRDLAKTRLFIEQRWFDLCQVRGLELLAQVEPMSAVTMRRSWRTCDHVLVL